MCQIFYANLPFLDKSDFQKIFPQTILFLEQDGGHSDGTGVVNLETLDIMKTAEPASDTRLFGFQYSHKILAHVRKTTAGSNDARNSQPFISKDGLVFVHNGTFYNYRNVSTENKGEFVKSDSHEFFLKLLDEVNKNQDIGKVLKSMLKKAEGSAAIILINNNQVLIYKSAGRNLHKIVFDDGKNPIGVAFITREKSAEFFANLVRNLKNLKIGYKIESLPPNILYRLNGFSLDRVAKVEMKKRKYFASWGATSSYTTTYSGSSYTYSSQYDSNLTTLTVWNDALPSPNKVLYERVLYDDYVNIFREVLLRSLRLHGFVLSNYIGTYPIYRERVSPMVIDKIHEIVSNRNISYSYPVVPDGILQEQHYYLINSVMKYTAMLISLKTRKPEDKVFNVILNSLPGISLFLRDKIRSSNFSYYDGKIITLASVIGANAVNSYLV